MYNIALPKNQEFLDFDMYPCSKKEVIVPYVCLPACVHGSMSQDYLPSNHKCLNLGSREAGTLSVSPHSLQVIPRRVALFKNPKA